MKKTLFTFAFITLFHCLSAQSINISSIGNQRCADSLLSISFTTSGSFGTNNQFKIQYSSNYTTFIDLPTVSLVNNTISALIPKQVSSTTQYQVRIAATNPIVFSSYSQVSFKHIPSISLTGSNVGNNSVDKGTSVFLFANVMGGGTYKLVLNDSTKVTNTSISSVAVNPIQTFTYRAISLSNECGVTTSFNDSVKVNVSEIGFRITNVSTRKLCSNEPLYIYFDTTNLLPTNTPLQVEFINSVTQASYSFPINGTTSPLMVTIPGGFPSADYNLRLYSDSPKFSATYSQITIGVSPTLSYSSNSYSIKYGETAAISIITSMPSGSYNNNYLNAILNDTLVTTFQINGYNELKYFLVTPTQTNTYRLTRAFSTECNNVPVSHLQPITITVNPNIYIDSLTQNRTTFCVGSTITAYYRSNLNINPNDLRIRLTGNGVNQIITPLNASINSVTFSIPNVSFSSNYGIKLVNTATSFEGTNYRFPITINSAVAATITDTTPVVSQGIVSTTLPITLNGYANDIVITLSDGTQQRINSISYTPFFINLPIVISESTTLSISSVQSTCGNGATNGSKTFTINPSIINAISIKPPNSATFCAGTNLNINFGTQGNFDTNNIFRLEISNNNSNTFTPIAVFEGVSSPIMATLPTVVGSYKLRVSSTSPVVRSAEFIFSITNTQRSATITSPAYSPYGYVSSPYIGNETVLRPDGVNYALNTGGSLLNIDKNQPVTFMINFSGTPPFNYTLSNGTQFTTSNSYASHTVFPSANSTTYSITSFSDACGVGSSTGSFVVNTQPLFLKSVVYLDGYCVGSEMKIPYIMNGRIPAGMTLKAKIAESNSTNYQLLSTREEDRNLYVLLPTTLQALRHNIQIFGETSTQNINSTLSNSSNASYGYQIDIKTKASGLLSEINGINPVYITDGQSVMLKTVFSGQPNYSFLLSNNIRYTSSSNTYNFSVTPNRDSLTYFLNEISNQCGFGNYGGSVTVVKRPTLASNGILKLLCPNETFNFLFFASGLYGTNNLFKFYITQGNTYKEFLGETTTKGGNISLRIPSQLSRGNYAILIETTEGGGISHSTPILIGSSATATLSGNTTINIGETTFLKVTLTNVVSGSANFNYTLSNGQTGTSNSTLFYIPVNPTVPTNYVLTSLTGGCGNNITTGSAFVNVNPFSNNTISTTENFQAICAGRTYSISFTRNFANIPNTLFKVQLSDKNGENFVDIPTTGSSSPLMATIPDNLEYGENYRLRVVCDIYGVMSGANVYPLVYSLPASISLTDNPPIIERNAIKNIELNLTGTPSWSFQLQVGNKYYSGTATSSPYYFNINEPAEGNTIKLVSVSNSVCGYGNVYSPNTYTFCPPAINISQPILNNETYQSGSIITAKNVITNNAKVIFDAKQSIILNAGFKADANTVFETKLVGCNN